MPFTPSHVAAVVPLRGRWGLPLAALAAGSMSPDLFYFLPGGVHWPVRPPTHSIPGIFTWDLVLAVAIWAAWRWAAPALYDLAPSFIRQRWRLPASMPPWRLIAAAVIIGAMTHVGWDEFTHAGRFGPRHLSFLAAEHPGPLGPMAGFKYAQYASGLFGLAVLAWVGWRQPRHPVGPRRDPHLFRLAPVVVVGLAAVAGAVRIAITGLSAPASYLVFDGLTATMGAGCLAVGLMCLAHRMRRR